ncbi:MAG: formate--phosphoribosylaminoimidazolecarboxamide ligase family protein [Candidatus Caldarchaeum sp.]|nr:formate--phosphoribosylaminoimidazolecarboxamide ligase family protein [Candidatus Caldarchaeum sp.]MDW8360406.1 formate--phosphoribosylaminoimidazolecarboxamide ligase family protein [Candidatus Caldarchaeum sp.]
MVQYIAVLASHSALDVLDGARDEGFKTAALAKKGRETAYREFPVVDELLVMEEYVEIVSERVQERLRNLDAVFVPNRSFAVYVGYDRIERDFNIPVYGNKRLLRWEERVGESSYYRLLDEANIKRPKTCRLEEVDGPVIVKLPESTRRAERAFFIASDRNDLSRKLESHRRMGLVDDVSVKQVSVEQLVLGAHFNANFFHSIVRNRLELHSVDRRIQSNLDGVYRVPASDQLSINPQVSYIEVGHEPATLRESLLEKVFAAGKKFIEACGRLVPPGVIGPFTLQFIVTPDLDLVVYDVALRIGGGTNVYLGLGGQYSKLYHGRPLSMGRRIALEVREAVESGLLPKVTT